jgi:hypothetical protein
VSTSANDSSSVTVVGIGDGGDVVVLDTAAVAVVAVAVAVAVVAVAVAVDGLLQMAVLEAVGTDGGAEKANVGDTDMGAAADGESIGDTGDVDTVSGSPVCVRSDRGGRGGGAFPPSSCIPRPPRLPRAAGAIGLARVCVARIVAARCAAGTATATGELSLRATSAGFDTVRAVVILGAGRR